MRGKRQNGLNFSIRGAREGGTNLLSAFEGNAKTSAELAITESVITAFDWYEGQNHAAQIIGHPNALRDAPHPPINVKVIRSGESK